MPAPKLKDLHAALIATLNGYKEALAKSDDATIQALCQSMIALRTQHHAELHDTMERLGEHVDDDSSVMSKVQEIVIDVRSAITGIDKDTLPSFIRGEESIAGKYDEALAEVAGDVPASDILRNQRAAAVAKTSEMKALSPS